VTACDTLSIANQDGAHAAVRHLLALGHRRIATVTGPATNVDARQRVSGYRMALEEAGLPHDPGLEIEGDFTEPSGYRAVRSLLALSPRPDAVFFGNDYMAIGAMSALAEASVRVPDDLAVVGFDDIAMARFVTPALTTVHVDLIALGARAVERVLHPREPGDDAGPHHETVAGRLVVRRSCGAAESDRTDHLSPSDRRRRHS